ncbi:transmembrane amino acid transporter protein-domain-containing protein [Phycomyces nitens]|nr:transmembrane amino acid transporter protein-domain-containing protein [Phycomyces nitens]
MYYGATPNKLYRNLSKAERDLLQSDRPGYGSCSIFEVSFNLVNATVGAGIMGLPFAIAHAGFFAGILLSIFVAILSQVGLYMLIVAGQRVGVYKFAQLVEYVLGRFGYHFLNCIILIQTGGACLSYFILLGDTLTVLADRYVPQVPLLADRVFVVSMVSLVLILPLNMSRSIGALARWSIVAVCCLPVILVTILVRAPAYAPDKKIPLEFLGDDMFSSLGIMAFAFTCSQVAFNNYLTLEHQTPRTWGITTSVSTFISWGISIVFAIIGYLCFGSSVQPNLFMNFAADDLVINIGRLALAGDMVLTLPMAFFPFREAVQKLLGLEKDGRQPTDFQHNTITVVFFGLLLAGGVTIQSLGKVYALVGGVAATTLAYILPAIAYLCTRSAVNQPTFSTNTLFPTLTVSTAVSYDDYGKTPLFSDVASLASSSTRLPYFDEEDVSTVGGDDVGNLDELDSGLQSCWWLNATAGLLIVWGCLVMFFSTSAVLSQA